MEHLARLEASTGSALRAHSPAPVVGSSVMFSSPVLGGGAGLASDGSGPPLDCVDGGADFYGEFLLSRGVTGGLSSFVMMPELFGSLCHGAVLGGIKFCTLGSGACSFSSHSKKVPITMGHIYISTGRNSTFTNCHVPAAALPDSDLQTLLLERHSEIGWLQLFQVIDQIPPDTNSGNGPVTGDSAMEHNVLAYVTSGQKRKDWYQDSTLALESSADISEKSPHLRTTNSFGSNNLVILPSLDSQEPMSKEWMLAMLGQWDRVVSTINKSSSSMVKKLQAAIDEDFNSLEGKLLDLRVNLGMVPVDSGFEDCISAWDGLLLMHNKVEAITLAQEATQSELLQHSLMEDRIKKALLDSQQQAKAQTE
jgi:hypothetical protein